jgi:TM2 domain-containing membrane protein YozV
VPIVAALPLLFFGLLWFAAVQTVSGILLLILASTIWMLFDWLRERSR